MARPPLDRTAITCDNSDRIHASVNEPSVNETVTMQTTCALACLAFLVLSACSSDGGGATEPTPPTPAIACGPDERSDDTGACVHLGWTKCPAGFALDAAGFGCTEVLPATTCAARSMPVLGQSACAPVAAAACAAGFEARPDGWGCRAVAASACTGATMEVLGRAACAPVGNCGGAFPPAGATYVVDAAFTPGQIDATHVKTIGAALAAAPAGAVIAVNTGSYAEVLALPRSVRVVGRCAGQVTVTAPPPANVEGVQPGAGTDSTIEGLTLTGHLAAAVVDGGAKLTLRNVVIDGNVGGGILAAGAGTRVTLDHSVVRASVDSTLAKGYGVEASAGAEVLITASAITANTGFGIQIVGKGSHGRIEKSVIARTASDAKQDFGVGLMVRTGATAEVLASSLSENRETSVVSYGPGTSVTLTDTTIDATKNSGVGYGRGVLVDGGTVTLERVTVAASTDIGVLAEVKGTATLTDSVVVGTVPGDDGKNGFGVSAISGGTITLKGSALVGNQQSGAAAIGANAKVVLESSLVAATGPDSDGERGFGVDLESGGIAEVRGSALVGNTSAGVAAIDAGSKLTMTNSVVLGTRADAKKKAGRGLAIETGAVANVSASAFVGNRDIGISIRGTGAKATIDQAVVRGTLPLASTGTHGRGIEVGSGAQATLTQVSALENHGVAVLAINKGSIDLQNAWIADTAADGTPGGPGRAVTAQDGGIMTILGLVAQRSRQAGILVAAGGASLTVRGSRVEEVAAGDNEELGHGLTALEGSSLVVDDVTVRRCAAVGLVFDAASGTVRASRVTDNAVGIFAQGGSELLQVAVVPEAPIDGQVSVSVDTVFTDNATRVGSGVVPVPSPL